MRNALAASRTRCVDHRALLSLVARSGKGDVLVRRQMRIQRKQLEHERDVAIGRLQVLHRLAVDQDLAAVDVLEAGDGTQRRGLAAAGWAQQHDEFAGRGSPG